MKDALCPAVRTSGVVIPRTCKSELEPEIALIVTAEVVPLVSVSCRVLVVPTATVPKLRLADPNPTLPPPPPEPPADRDWHPVSDNEPTTIKNKPSQTLCNR